MDSPRKISIWALFKYRVRSIVLAFDSLFFGRRAQVVLPNGKQASLRLSYRERPPSFQVVIDHEIAGYWQEHQPKPGEVHFDVGAQLGSYSLLALSSGAIVYAFEPDPNNRRFLRRNLRKNEYACTIIERGVWNEHAVLPWRSETAASSIQGVGVIPIVLPSLDQIEVDRMDTLVAPLNLSRLDVIKMDIEGAEIEALQGAVNTIKKFKPLLLVEAYHPRGGRPTFDRVLSVLEGFGIPKSCLKVTTEGLVVARDY